MQLYDFINDINNDKLVKSIYQFIPNQEIDSIQDKDHLLILQNIKNGLKIAFNRKDGLIKVNYKGDDIEMNVSSIDDILSGQFGRVILSEGVTEDQLKDININLVRFVTKSEFLLKQADISKWAALRDDEFLVEIANGFLDLEIMYNGKCLATIIL